MFLPMFFWTVMIKISSGNDLTCILNKLDYNETYIKKTLIKNPLILFLYLYGIWTSRLHKNTYFLLFFPIIYKPIKVNQLLYLWALNINYKLLITNYVITFDTLSAVFTNMLLQCSVNSPGTTRVPKFLQLKTCAERQTQ